MKISPLINIKKVFAQKVNPSVFFANYLLLFHKSDTVYK